MRNIEEVITKIIDQIPEKDTDFRDKINDVLNSVAYTAPEIISHRWGNLSLTLMHHIPFPATEDWEFQILHIFSEKNIDEIKKIHKNG